MSSLEKENEFIILRWWRPFAEDKESGTAVEGISKGEMLLYLFTFINVFLPARWRTPPDEKIAQTVYG